MYVVFVMVKFGNKIECYKRTLRVCSSILCVSVYMFVWFKKFLVGMFRLSHINYLHVSASWSYSWFVVMCVTIDYACCGGWLLTMTSMGMYV